MNTEMNKTPIPRMDVFGGMHFSVISGLTTEEGAKAKSKLFAAFLKTKCNLVQPTNDKDGVKFSNGSTYKYATLNAVLEAIKIAIGNEDLAYIQQPVTEGGKVGAHNYLINSLGAVLDLGSFLLDVSGARPQDAGGAMTYARRYSISSIFGIASEDDDDAQQFESKSEFYQPGEISTIKVVYHNKRVPITEVYSKALAGDEDASAMLKDKSNPAKVKVAIKSITAMWDFSKNITEKQNEENEKKRQAEKEKKKIDEAVNKVKSSKELENDPFSKI